MRSQTASKRLQAARRTARDTFHSVMNRRLDESDNHARRSAPAPVPEATIPPAGVPS